METVVCPTPAPAHPDSSDEAQLNVTRGGLVKLEPVEVDTAHAQDQRYNWAVETGAEKEAAEMSPVIPVTPIKRGRGRPRVHPIVIRKQKPILKSQLMSTTTRPASQRIQHQQRRQSQQQRRPEKKQSQRKRDKSLEKRQERGQGQIPPTTPNASTLSIEKMKSAEEIEALLDLLQWLEENGVIGMKEHDLNLIRWKLQLYFSSRSRNAQASALLPRQPQQRLPFQHRKPRQINIITGKNLSRIKLKSVDICGSNSCSVVGDIVSNVSFQQESMFGCLNSSSAAEPAVFGSTSPLASASEQFDLNSIIKSEPNSPAAPGSPEPDEEPGELFQEIDAFFHSSSDVNSALALGSNSQPSPSPQLRTRSKSRSSTKTPPKVKKPPRKPKRKAGAAKALPRERFKCKICGVVQKNKYELAMHKAEHRDNPTGPAEEHPCQVCGRKFNKSRNLSRHVMRVHTENADDRPHLCDQCPKTYKHHFKLMAHMATHREETPFICPHCGKGFKIKLRLAKHLYVHSTDQPFKCQFCPKAFRRRAHLLQHERIHTQDKRYKCEPCGKAFVQIGSLKFHNKTHHPELNLGE